MTATTAEATTSPPAPTVEASLTMKIIVGLLATAAIIMAVVAIHAVYTFYFVVMEERVQNRPIAWHDNPIYEQP